MNSAFEELSLDQCPSKLKPLAKTVVNSSTRIDGNASNLTKSIEKLDVKLLSQFILSNSSTPLIPPIVYTIDTKRSIIFWEEVDKANRTLYSRIYNIADRTLDHLVAITSFQSLKQLNLTKKKINNQWMLLKWCPLEQCSKKIEIKSPPFKRRKLANTLNHTNSRFNFTSLNLTLVPSQVVLINRSLVVSVQIAKGYNITLQQVIRSGEPNLTADWVYYNSSSRQLLIYPTRSKHLGKYSFLIQAENSTQIIKHTFQVTVVSEPASHDTISPYEDFFENFCRTLALGTGIATFTILLMCIYHYSCGTYRRRYYKHLRKRYIDEYVLS